MNKPFRLLVIGIIGFIFILGIYFFIGSGKNSFLSGAIKILVLGVLVLVFTRYL